MAYPWSFGFVPATLGDDGDPLDVLVITDEPVPVGMVVAFRLLGAVAAEQQKKDGPAQRNDRFFGVASSSLDHHGLASSLEVVARQRDAMERFFVDYNRQKGVAFRPLQRHGAAAAAALLADGQRRFARCTAR